MSTICIGCDQTDQRLVFLCPVTRIALDSTGLMKTLCIDRWKQELHRMRERLQSQENSLKDREEKAVVAASAASTVSAAVAKEDG